MSWKSGWPNVGVDWAERSRAASRAVAGQAGCRVLGSAWIDQTLQMSLKERLGDVFRQWPQAGLGVAFWAGDLSGTGAVHRKVADPGRLARAEDVRRLPAERD